MPIGPITPGTPVVVTPDANPAILASMQAPTATMDVVGADVQVVTLALLNLQTIAAAGIGAGFACTGDGTWVDIATGASLIPTSDLSKWAIAISQVAFMPLDIPHGSKLTAISANIRPAAHASIVGLTLPILSYLSVPRDGSASTALNLPDTSGSAVAYSAVHAFGGSGLGPFTIDRNANAYYVKLTWEHGGANELAGFICQPTFTVNYT